MVEGWGMENFRRSSIRRLARARCVSDEVGLGVVEHDKRWSEVQARSLGRVWG